MSSANGVGSKVVYGVSRFAGSANTLNEFNLGWPNSISHCLIRLLHKSIQNIKTNPFFEVFQEPNLFLRLVIFLVSELS